MDSKLKEHKVKDHAVVENDFFIVECGTQLMGGAGLTSND